MDGLKKRIIRKIINMGKKNHRLRMPAIALTAVFLMLYYVIRDFFLQFKYHPVRQRLLAGILIIALLAGQIAFADAFAVSEGQEETATVAPGVITADQEWGDTTLLTAGTYTIQEGVTVTVSGRLTVDGAVTINGGGKLVRADSYIGSTSSNGSNSAMLYLDNSGDILTLENITVDGNSVNANGPAVYMGSGTVVNMNSGAVIQNNYNMNVGSTAGTYGGGGGIHCESGTLNINGGAVKNCKTEGTVNSSLAYAHAGGGVYLKGTCNMTSGSITGNSASNGGGIYLASSGATLCLTGGTISGNQVNGEGSGIYYSTVNYATAKLSIGGDANVSDTIFLDNTHGTLYPLITSKLNYKITMKCNSTTEGKILAKGSGYTLTGVDASKVSMENSDLYSKLDAENNQIVLSQTEETEAKWQESSGGEWKTGKFTTALENVYSGGTIKLLKDVIFTKKVEIAKAVMITSENPTGPYTITRMPDASQDYGNITLTGSGSLTLTNVIYDGNKDAGEGETTSLIEVGAGTALTLGSGCTICNGHKSGGSGAVAVYGAMTMNSGAVIENCEVSGTGGAVWISSSGTFTMNGGTIQSCTAGEGGVAISADGSCILNEGTITGNTDNSDKNCAVYLNSTGSGSLTLKGAAISGNAYSVYNEGKSVSVTGNSSLSGSIYTTNAIKAGGDGVSGLTKVYSIKMGSVTSGAVVVKGSRDSAHYQLENSGYMLIPADNATNLIAAGKYAVTYVKNSGTIANESNYTGYTYGKGLTLPTPARKGYTFGGWYITPGFTGNAVTGISTTETGDKTYYAKWTANKYTVTFDYQGATGGRDKENMTVAYDGTYGTLPEPAKKGYTFKGWYTKEKGGGSQIMDATTVTATADHTLYAYWKDETAPDKPVLQRGVTLQTGWTNTQTVIRLSLKDGVAVTGLWVSVDGGSYTQAEGFTGGTGSADYSYPVMEGEHTYQFKAKDAAGNTSEASEVFTVRLDTRNPVFGELDYENKAANLWQWIIGKKSMIVYVPVTDIGSNGNAGSGVAEIAYTMTPVDSDGKPDSSSAVTKTAEVINGRAKITFSENFKGSIAITCTDAAGNAASGIMVGTNGVIVEDTAPAVTSDVQEGYYDTAPALTIAVKDDKDNAITAGIASITYQIGNGAAKAVAVDAGALQTEVSFTIPASKIPTGVTAITVKAKDNAGNETSVIITVKVKETENQPAAEINYQTEKLTGLVPGAEYTVDGMIYTADKDGCIDIDESWIGTTIELVKSGNGSTSAGSKAQNISIPERPSEPSSVPELAVRTDNSITLKEIDGAQYRINDGSWQDSPEFTGLSEKTVYTFTVYYPATDDTFASTQSHTVSIATLPSAPVQGGFLIDYTEETFTLEDGVEAFADEACTVPVTSGSLADYMGQSIYIRYAADGGIPESAATEVPIPSRPSAPSAGTGNASYPGAQDGRLTGLEADTGYQISADNGATWTDVTADENGEIAGLAPGSYIVRVSSTDSDFAGKPSARVTVAVCQITYTITYHLDGGRAEGNPQSYTVESGRITLNNPVKEGYTFTGWSGTGLKGSDNKSVTIAAGSTGDRTYTAHWKRNTESSSDDTPETEPPQKADDTPETEAPQKADDTPETEPPQKADDTPETETPQKADDTPETENRADSDNNTDNTDSTQQEETETQKQTEPLGGMDTTDRRPEGETVQTVPVSVDGGKLVLTGDPVGTGTMKDTSKTTTLLTLGEGTVIVTVVCEEETVTAGVRDTVAVANAVLSPKQIQLAGDGETIEIRVDVKDISKTVSGQDKEVIEGGLTECRKELPGLTPGTYIDISMFVRIGGDHWAAVTSTEEPIEVLIGIPEELKEEGREFYIIRSHDGEYTLLPDMDDAPDTITVNTNRFSAYAIAYRKADKSEVLEAGESSAKCGLCHICPTFLGICCFIWLAVVLAILLIVLIFIWRKRKKAPTILSLR